MGETLLAAKNASFRPLARACAQTLAAAALAAGPAHAQESGQLEEVFVTATRRSENMQQVPISVSALEGERMDALFEGADDIRALATRGPSLYAESSNGPGASPSGYQPSTIDHQLFPNTASTAGSSPAG